MLVPMDAKDKTKGAALKAFLTWGLTEGQKHAAPLRMLRWRSRL